MQDDEELARARKAQQMKALLDKFDPIHYASIAKVVAEERKIEFDAHIAAGFTEAQTIALLKRT